MKDFFDVIIIGAGPAGMSAAYTLLHSSPNIKLGIIDKGKDIHSRLSIGFEKDSLISGAGGSGLFSDGKLLLSLKAGGKLDISNYDADRYVNYIDTLFASFDGYSVINNGTSQSMQQFVEKYGLQYKNLPIRHFGSYNLKNILINFWKRLEELGANTFFEMKVMGTEKKSDHWEIWVTDRAGNKTILRSINIIFAVGKEGSIWLSNILKKRHKIRFSRNRTYFGIRVETLFAKELTRLSFDPKLYMHFEDGTKMKTHCFNRRGQVLLLKYFGLPLAGGHSAFTEKNKQGNSIPNTSFAVLLSDTPDKSFDFKMVFNYMKAINFVTKGNLLVQRLGDFIRNESTTFEKLENNTIRPSMKESIPGNIASLGLPFNFNQKFLDFIYRLAHIDPDIFIEDTLIYAPAIEWWMPRIETDDNLETEMKGLYAIGDGAGISQGIAYAATSGLIAAESILSS